MTIYVISNTGIHFRGKNMLFVPYETPAFPKGMFTGKVWSQLGQKDQCIYLSLLWIKHDIMTLNKGLSWGMSRLWKPMIAEQRLTGDKKKKIMEVAWLFLIVLIFWVITSMYLHCEITIKKNPKHNLTMTWHTTYFGYTAVYTNLSILAQDETQTLPIINWP